MYGIGNQFVWLYVHLRFEKASLFHFYAGGFSFERFKN